MSDYVLLPIPAAAAASIVWEVLAQLGITMRASYIDFLLVSVTGALLAWTIASVLANPPGLSLNRRQIYQLLAASLATAAVLELAIADPGSRLIAASSLLPVTATMAVTFKRPVRRRRFGLIDCGLQPEIKAELADEVDLITAPVDMEFPPNYTLLLAEKDAVEDPDWAKFILQATLAGCRTSTVSSYMERRTGRVRLGQPNLRARLARRQSQDNGYTALKSALDFAISLTGLIVLIPFFALVALLILVTMGKPVLFVQDRVGLNGRHFRMYKFRTMVANAMANDTATQKNDSRITRFGKLLRRTHIDELPQLWNILIGDMALIGPRPEQPSLAARYRKVMPEFDLRTRVKPGLTGWAQVSSGYASDECETRRKLEYDLYYVFNRSPALDIRIVARTVLVQFNSWHVR